MELLNSIFTWIIKKRYHQIEFFQKYPHEVQAEVLENLLATAKDTEVGRKHDFASIKSMARFQEQLPLQTYEDVKADIERMQHGETDVLWPGEIKWFAKSSGTTSDKSKFIPMSREAIEECHFKAGKDMLSIYAQNYPEHRIFGGRNFSLAGSWQSGSDASDFRVGDLSSILTEHLPLWVELRRTPRKPIALLESFEEKVDRIVQITATQDVRSITGAPAWMLVVLKKLLEHTGKENVLEVWPNLEVFMHGGVGFTPYQEVYRELIPGDQMHYLNIYNASEGFFAIQDGSNSNEMLLMLDYGIFYEFIPLEEADDEHPTVLTLDQVECDKPYALVISTNAGLWRYQVGDVIKFSSINPYRVVVAGRTKHFINAFGEELMIENAEAALAIACEKTGAVVHEYTAGPVYMDGRNNGRHEWMMEFEKPPQSPEYFLEVLDNALKSLNSDYEAKRYKNITLAPPTLEMLEHGTFYRWMKSRNKVGGQNKVPRLANNRVFLDSLHDFCGHKRTTFSITA